VGYGEYYGEYIAKIILDGIRKDMQALNTKS